MCSGALTGQQRKYCADPECKRLGQRAEWVMKTYGITLEQFDEILLFQQGKCGVCRNKFRDDETPHIDHEHGAHIRGLVHAYCNRRLIGRLKSAELAQGLADYLRDPPAVAALGVKVIAPGRPSEKKRRVYRRRK